MFNSMFTFYTTVAYWCNWLLWSSQIQGGALIPPFSQWSRFCAWLQIIPIKKDLVKACSWHTYVPASTNVIVVQSLSCAQLFATLWIAACQYSLSFTISQILLKLMSIELVRPCNHFYLIICCPLLLLPSAFPSFRVFFNKSALCIR